ncbi:ACT domain-containing protein [Alteromonas sp. ASW11-36]|uniref:ACT domain-containing protein n=1 Tax=Alteromonas arenosi TaxID=3055817 RepID=A0ABT7SVS1_9ALTE|nr:ACT domain-containing protein [Alteromonas sp. ASW11-36]MDM7860270.1 ACT domain-containing protein [Alteromonas sp. ASW11-36]
MSGERDLSILLASMAPALDPDKYVFCTIAVNRIPTHIQIKGSFAESEGMTLIVTKSEAEKHGLDYSGVFRCITLTVHSSLDAVGLTAAVATTLAAQNISANVVAAFYHDHIFVGQSDAAQAVEALTALARKQASILRSQ